MFALLFKSLRTITISLCACTCASASAQTLFRPAGIHELAAQRQEILVPVKGHIGWVDHAALRRDFKALAPLSELQINQILLRCFAYLNDTQIRAAFAESRIDPSRQMGTLHIASRGSAHAFMEFSPECSGIKKLQGAVSLRGIGQQVSGEPNVDTQQPFLAPHLLFKDIITQSLAQRLLYRYNADQLTTYRTVGSYFLILVDLGQGADGEKRYAGISGAQSYWHQRGEGSMRAMPVEFATVNGSHLETDVFQSIIRFDGMTLNSDAVRSLYRVENGQTALTRASKAAQANFNQDPAAFVDTFAKAGSLLSRKYKLSEDAPRLSHDQSQREFEILLDGLVAKKSDFIPNILPRMRTLKSHLNPYQWFVLQLFAARHYPLRAPVIWDEVNDLVNMPHPSVNDLLPVVHRSSREAFISLTRHLIVRSIIKSDDLTHLPRRMQGMHALSYWLKFYADPQSDYHQPLFANAIGLGLLQLLTANEISKDRLLSPMEMQKLEESAAFVIKETAGNMLKWEPAFRVLSQFGAPFSPEIRNVLHLENESGKFTPRLKELLKPSCEGGLGS